MITKNKTRKDEIFGRIRTTYEPDWKAAPNKRAVLKHVAQLYSLPKNSAEYFKLKSEVVTYLSMNCLEQMGIGKTPEASNTRRILEDLMADLSFTREDM